jgi:N-acetyl-anhydromuramyl-L-alanine amidase AmpD
MSYPIITARRTPNLTRYPKGHSKAGQPVVITPQGILIHSDEGVAAGSLSWLCNPESGVSSTYYLTRSAVIYQLAEDYYRTWHGGVGSWDDVRDLNTLIGIECEHKAGQDWPKAQMDALTWLCKTKITQYAFPRTRIAAHRWAAEPPGRKSDPTDWSDADLRAWIDQLYRPAGEQYRVLRQTWTRTSPTSRPDNRAWATLPAGRIVMIDQILPDEQGEPYTWGHWIEADARGVVLGQAFIRMDQLEKYP